MLKEAHRHTHKNKISLLFKDLPQTTSFLLVSNESATLWVHSYPAVSSSHCFLAPIHNLWLLHSLHSLSAMISGPLEKATQYMAHLGLSILQSVWGRTYSAPLPGLEITQQLVSASQGSQLLLLCTLWLGDHQSFLLELLAPEGSYLTQWPAKTMCFLNWT